MSNAIILLLFSKITLPCTPCYSVPCYSFLYRLNNRIVKTIRSYIIDIYRASRAQTEYKLRKEELRRKIAPISRNSSHKKFSRYGWKMFSPLPSDDKIPSLSRVIVRRQYNTLRVPRIDPTRHFYPCESRIIKTINLNFTIAALHTAGIIRPDNRIKFLNSIERNEISTRNDFHSTRLLASSDASARRHRRRLGSPRAGPYNVTPTSVHTY